MFLSTDIDNLKQKGFQIVEGFIDNENYNSNRSKVTHSTNNATITPNNFQSMPISSELPSNISKRDSQSGSNIDIYNQNNDSLSSRNIQNSHAILQQKLKESIDLCNSCDEHDINTQSINSFEPALDEHCKIIKDNQLIFKKTINDINIYADKSISENDVYNDELFQAFIDHVLIPLGSHVFGLNNKVMRIYYDNEGTVVAFNRQRTLFFNLRYFKGLHYNDQFDSNKETKIEALIYW